MSAYALALFLHILGAMALSAGFAIEGVGLWRLRAARSAGDARAALGALAVMPRLYIPATVLLLLSGLYMTVTGVGWAAGWPAVGLASMVLLAVVGAALTGPRMAAIGRALDAPDASAASVDWVRHTAIPRASFQARMAIVLGIVFLMTVKPSLNEALLVMAIAIAFGLASTIPLSRRRQATTPVA